MGHRLAPAVPLLLAIFSMACDGSAPMDTFELSGRVTVLLESPDGGSQIAGARVLFVSDTLLATETVTDADGRYRMRVVTDHPFGQVRAEAEGFLPSETTVLFDTPQRRVDIELRRAPSDP